MSGNETIRLFLCGDVMTGRGIDQVLPHPGDPLLCENYVKSALDYVALAERANGPIRRPVGFDDIWGDALATFARFRPDARIVNLETSVTTSGACEPKGINYRMNPANLPCLAAAQIGCCGLANNHVLDWGPAGLIETLESLAGAGIRTAGAGRDGAKAEAPAILDVAGKGRVLVFAWGLPSSGIPRTWAASTSRPGVNYIEDLSAHSVERIAAAVRTARSPGDLVVVSLHWGSNWGYEISSAERDFAHALIDRAGADVVHGHSSHHAKAIEVHNGRPILYGCGDFLNDYEGIEGYESYRDDLVLMYFVDLALDGSGLNALRMVPLQIRNFRLNRAAPADAAWLGRILTREGAIFGTGVKLDPDETLELVWR